jgi:hypothetical protein
MGSGKTTASLTFDVPAGKFGAITYNFAKSPKGGSAQLYLDGTASASISYGSVTGTTKDPQFGSSQRFAGLQPGRHTLEIRADGVSYIDNFVLESSSSNASPSSGPGATTSSTSALGIGQELVSQITVPANATAISIVTEAPAGMLVRVGLVGATGISLATADTSSGLAVINQPVTGGGVYLIKTSNLSAGPVSVWTVSTPLVNR